ncbi:phosphoribosylanthranilate isomerase [uncultured Sunxiuqinia sp.]|uniref:phosphoribosylanthranilate isomerase n=1 Tax=uncultured Sunxiuqinia sp. TaxID=1573825 RepID=UPI0026047212|nr:phosphoribosylanthranilate isomerase [uncultured Sunxiuqinia sp.]
MKARKVKVCGMRDPENIRGVLEAAPEYLGYIFYPKSKRFVGERPDSSIFSLVPESTQKVAVFVNEELEKVLAICRNFQLQVAQLHGQESPAYCQQVRQAGLTVFKAFSVDDQFDFSVLKAYESVVDYFLFDTKGKLPGGTGLKFNWDILKNYTLKVPFLLSGGIGPDDVETLSQLKHDQLFAFDINSGFELEPALKDVGQVKVFISQIRKNSI